MNEPSPLENKRLNAILAEYLKRKDAGQPLNEEALLKAYPDLADGLRSYFQGEALIGNAVPKSAAETVQPKSNRESISGNVRETLRPRTRQPETASELFSRSFGRYTILRQLGEGAMGNVYLAHDTALDRQIALKVPKAPVGGNEDFMARFTREAKAAAGLKHPNICSVYDADQYNGIPYITMDFIDGVPLSRFIGSKKLQSVDSVLQMISTIAEAVDHAHSKGVIHRDLKPGNILVDATFRPHITDFGLARRVGQFDEAKATHEGLLLGTPAYMAPEQVKGEQAKVGPQSDIYSLGVMLFELLTSRLPFEGSVPEMLAQVLRDSPPVPSRIRKDLTEDIDDLCLKMLRKEPNKRYLSMAEVVSTIQRLRKKTEKAIVTPVDVKAPQSPFDIRQAHIEALLRKGQYAAAIQDLEKLAREKAAAARKVVEWAQKQLPRVRAEEKSLNPAGIEAFLNTATQLYEKYDYAGCIQLLTDIPSLRRSENMEDLLRNATKKELESEQLLSDIKDAERRKVLDGVEPLVNRLLKLKPGNTYAQRLWEAMQSYRSTAASRRKYRFENGRLQPSAETGFLRHWYVIAILVGVLAFLPGYFYSTSYFSSEQQALTLHVDENWLRTQGGEITLVIDGKSHTITNHTLHDDFSVTVTLGSHTVSVLSDDSVVHDSRTIEVQKSGPHLLHLNAEDLSLLASIPGQTIDPMDVPAAAFDPSIESATSPTEAVNAVADIARDLQPEAPSLQEEITNSLGMKLRLIPEGEFLMGSPADETGRDPDEQQHSVRIAEQFYIQTTEVSQKHWRTLMGTEPWKGRKNVIEGDDFPATHVSWLSAADFCHRLSVKDGVNYRLPTEAEWEYSCRAGSNAPHSFEGHPDNLEQYAWYDFNALNQGERFAHRIERKLPNAFGLYDMHGNVAEWCADWYIADYGKYPKVSPPGPRQGQDRVNRGASWESFSKHCRSANRGGNAPEHSSSILGFRVVLSPTVELPDAVTVNKTSVAPPQISSQPDQITNSIGMKMKLIPAGEFTIGSPASEPGRNPDETQHRVTLTVPFLIGVHEVTQSQYEQITGSNPSHFKGANNPVEMVSWGDAVAYSAKLSALPAEVAAGRVYRLPTEAEWEYACRAGTTSEYSFADNEKDLGKYAWFDDSSVNKTHTVGEKLPNGWGLYDMHGNVWEWCSYVDSSNRVYRGGGWNNDATRCRTAGRGASAPTIRTNDIGFRLALSSPSVSLAKSEDTAAPKAGQVPPAAVAPFDTAQAKVHQKAWADHLGVPVESTNSIGMTFVVIPAGEFTMGSPQLEAGRREQGEVEHRVTLTQPFEMGIFEVMQAQYEHVVSRNPSKFTGVENPVESVSWADAVEFCRLLSALPAERAAGRTYRLPTEAEWEYSCRAGSKTAYSFGDDNSKLGEYVWFDQNSNNTTHPVGQKKPNAWGLYDMSGNVMETCSDFYDINYHRESPSVDPQGPSSGSSVVSKGGCWFRSALEARSALRGVTTPTDNRHDFVGFRVVVTPSVPMSMAVTDNESSVPSAQISLQPDPKQLDYPSIAGEWQEAPGILFSITQNGPKFTATTTYQHKATGDIRAVVSGTVSKEGKIISEMEHIQAPSSWAKWQRREANLSPDGKTIRGHAVFNGGEHDFVWTLQP